MFQNEALKNHLETSYTVKSQSAIIAEWNMNIPGNVQKLGNYRYRKDSTAYSALPNIFDVNDVGNFYTNATDADVTVEVGFEEDETTPALFTYRKNKEKLYYSLEDCIKPFRPRSGINKASFFNSRYFANTDKDMFRRPRYYMPHRDDEFKYWRSYRTETYTSLNGSIVSTDPNKEYGISKISSGGYFFIDDAVPFVVYKESVPANRIVVKVQTNVGSVDSGRLVTSKGSSTTDPFFGDENKTTPVIFDVQYLAENNKWINAISFNKESVRSDGSPIFSSDGHLSLSYGLEVPEAYRDVFILVGTINSYELLPASGSLGEAFMVVPSAGARGTLYIHDGNEFISYTPRYTWSINPDAVYQTTPFVTDVTNPSSFTDSGTQYKLFREFVFLKGLRVVVKSMNKPNIPFELIEMSPRLEVDFSSNTDTFTITKSLSDLSSSPLPVGQVTASTGSVVLFDETDAFNQNNIWNGSSGSIIAKYLDNSIKFKLFETIMNVDGNSYTVPLKTLYSQGFPKVDQETSSVSIDLRDLYFYFESVKAPQLLLTEVSLGQAVGILLDSIGFSNYTFNRLSDESDPVIPYFFVAPEQNVAEVLNQLAVATQTAMFFDEYNNFIVMSKNYMLDETGERAVNMTLYGSQDSNIDGINKNVYPDKLSNIIEISSQDKKVLNAGTINYTSRYIQRSYGTLKQSQVTDQEKTWIYKPVLLWEVSGTEATKSLNNEKQQKYVLGAMPLNNNLSSNIPTVVNGELKDNVIDFGENVYYITRFQGYFYANAEIVRYDAVQYSISNQGLVWISSNLEYQDYFSKLPFSGKIYPTGLVRIYSKPYYETVDSVLKLKNGPVAEHGRGQFGTPIVSHSAGLDSNWTSDDYVQGCYMASFYLYSTADTTTPPVVNGSAGVLTSKAKQSKRNGIIKNLLSSAYQTETGISSLKTTQAGTVQSSALVMTGPTFTSAENPRDFISYVWKTVSRAQYKQSQLGSIKTLSSGLGPIAPGEAIPSSVGVSGGPISIMPIDPSDSVYKHFGTRLRIIGKIDSSSDRTQSPAGAMPYYSIAGADPTQTVTIGGGSAGISIVNPTTNNGYYFEIATLTNTDLEAYSNGSSGNNLNLHNVLFYKIQKDATSDIAIPVKLWGGNANILVDDGNFTGQYRFVGEENPTVYDLSMEYVDVNDTTRVFYLYLNQKLINIITDNNALKLSDTAVGLFTRGTTKAMFENIYALSKNYADNSVFDINTPIASVFDEDNKLNASEALSKYAISGMVQKTYLSGISPSSTKRYDLFYDEFGTIMREMAHFNIKYDRAYPALYANIAPTFNRIKGYSISGFMATSYGAEFLIFNNTDTMLNLDETTGNYLRILGVAFTQDTTRTLTVDDYFKKRGNLSDIELQGQTDATSPYTVLQDYNTLKNSIMKYGKSEFSLESPYIQDTDTAEDLMGWIINKSIRPRKSVGVKMFPNPTLQLGDIVTISYKTNSDNDVISSDSTRFVVYNIEYSKSVEGPEMTVYLSEV